MQLQAIREAKAAKVAEARAIVAKAENEKRSLTAEESANFATAKGEIEKLEADESRATFLADAERRMSGTQVSTGNADGYDRLQSQVSILKVLQAQVEGRSLTGAEAEYHAETERRTGRKAQGMFIPMRALEQRVNTTTSVPELVPTDYRPDQLINPLRKHPKLKLKRLPLRLLLKV